MNSNINTPMNKTLSEKPRSDEELLADDDEEVNFDSVKEVPISKKHSDKIGASSKKRAHSNDSKNRNKDK